MLDPFVFLRYERIDALGQSNMSGVGIWEMRQIIIEGQ
jgi:hypothetical protein